MKMPAKNRYNGGMGMMPPPSGSAGKVMGHGKPISGGTAYRPKSKKGNKVTKAGDKMVGKGSY